MSEVYDEEEVHAIFLGAIVTLQCCECGDVLQGEVVNDHPEFPGYVSMDLALPCPKCSTRIGIKAMAPVAILAGEQLAILDDGLSGSRLGEALDLPPGGGDGTSDPANDGTGMGGTADLPARYPVEGGE